jgi:hypothetical protein
MVKPRLTTDQGSCERAGTPSFDVDVCEGEPEVGPCDGIDLTPCWRQPEHFGCVVMKAHQAVWGN